MTDRRARPDPYEVLGVKQDASSADISRAYRRLARELHPDTHPDGTGAADRFRAVTAAYELLSEPARPAIYDGSAEHRPVRPASDAAPGVSPGGAGSQARSSGRAYRSDSARPPVSAAVRPGPVRVDPLPGQTLTPGEDGAIWLLGLIQLISYQARDESYWAW